MQRRSPEGRNSQVTQASATVPPAKGKSSRVVTVWFGFCVVMVCMSLRLSRINAKECGLWQVSSYAGLADDAVLSYEAVCHMLRLFGGKTATPWGERPHSSETP